MRAQEWDRERFSNLLVQITDATALTDQALADLAGRSRSQVNRWTRAEHQPSYQPLRRLVDNLAQYGPRVHRLGVELLEAAGYPTSDVRSVTATSSLGLAATAEAHAEDASLPAGVDPTSLPRHEVRIYELPDLTEQERDLLVGVVRGVRREIPPSDFLRILAEAMALSEQHDRDERPNGTLDAG